MEKNEEYFMREALKEAKKAFEDDEIPVGCVVVSNQQIIARSYNQTERLKDVTAHAEILAIGMAAHALGGKYLTDCEIYISLEPCVMCAGALFWAQPARIVWAASDTKRGCTCYGIPLFHPKTTVSNGILADESSQILKSFFAKLRD